jgi:uncharacterized protein with PQ loop repeat
VDASDFLGPLASFMGVLMSLAPLIQGRRVFHRRHADDVSQSFLLVIAVGSSAWLAYGISIADAYLIIPNALGVLTNIGTLLVVRRYTTQVAST